MTKQNHASTASKMSASTYNGEQGIASNGGSSAAGRPQVIPVTSPLASVCPLTGTASRVLLPFNGSLANYRLPLFKGKLSWKKKGNWTCSSSLMSQINNLTLSFRIQTNVSTKFTLGSTIGSCRLYLGVNRFFQNVRKYK